MLMDGWVYLSWDVNDPFIPLNVEKEGLMDTPFCESICRTFFSPSLAHKIILNLRANNNPYKKKKKSGLYPKEELILLIY